MMRVLVTGGAGFIGSHLCKRLLDEGCEVFCMDNFSTGNRANISGFNENERFHLIEHDICEPITDIEKIDEIYNLACPASPADFATMPEEILLVNSRGVQNILEVARTHSARLLHSSTSEVYGDPLEHPQKESYFGNVNPIGPRSCYDEGKRFAESFITTFAKKHNLDARIIRIFNTYGPNMNQQDGRVIPNFVTQALNGDALTVYGDGSQTRSFCYVSDMVDGIIACMRADRFDGPVNIGNPHEITIRELAEKIIELTKSSSSVTSTPMPEDDPKVRRPDISKATQLFSFSPEIGLDDGLQKTIQWFQTAQ